MNAPDEKWNNFIANLYNSEKDTPEPDSSDAEIGEFDKKQIKKIFDALPFAFVLGKANKSKSWAYIHLQISKNTNKYVLSFLKYAAIVVVAILVGGIGSTLLFTEDENMVYAEVSVPYGQMSQVTLFDGTKVWLNSGSVIRYPNQFNKNQRNVYLDGEAFFEVTKNLHQPFKVHAKNMEVEVLGTSFNVSAYKNESETTVTLVEGSVYINNESGEKIGELVPGQMALMKEGADHIAYRHVDTDFYAGWIEGKIVFNDVRLDELAPRLERWYNVEISFEKENLKSMKFSGTLLKNKPIDQILAALELLAPIKFQHTVIVNQRDKIQVKSR